VCDVCLSVSLSLSLSCSHVPTFSYSPIHSFSLSLSISLPSHSVLLTIHMCSSNSTLLFHVFHQSFPRKCTPVCQQTGVPAYRGGPPTRSLLFSSTRPIHPMVRSSHHLGCLLSPSSPRSEIKSNAKKSTTHFVHQCVICPPLSL
jgi:hypothetical protein